MPRREAHGAATPALVGPSGTAQYHLRGMSGRDLATPPEPSAVTGDGIQRSSAGSGYRLSAQIQNAQLRIGPLPDAYRTPAGRSETGHSLR